jgi:type IV secretory pathway VirD2 relaxase
LRGLGFGRRRRGRADGGASGFSRLFKGLSDGGLVVSEFDDDFLLWPGRVGADRPGRSTSFLGQVRRAVEAAGDAGPGPRRARAGRAGARTGRGAGRGAGGAGARDSARRVMVKARIVRQSGPRYRAAPLARHIAYLQREGVSRDAVPARMFDAAGEVADVASFAERCQDDRHHFRFIVSPEDAAELADLRAYGRDLMRRAEQDLGTRLDWVAIDHWNTDNPHLHILVRGRADDGQDLVIAGDYVAQGLRRRAEDLATLELGPRSQREIEAARDADISAERWTRLDRALVAAVKPEDRRVDLRRGGGMVEDRDRLLGRVAKLQALGLATPDGVGRWRLPEDLEPRLREISLRGDIIKTYHRAMAREGRAPTPERFVIHPKGRAEGVVGRLVERGLSDELSGAAYVLVDGLDGRQHHLAFADLADTTDAPPGAIVELRVFEGRDGARREALRVRSDLDLQAQVAARGATWLDRRLLGRPSDKVERGVAGFGAEVASAELRRAEVLVREGLATRRDGRLVATPGLLARLQARDLDAAAAGLAKEAGRPARPVAVGEAAAGVYQRRLDLASGRFAVLDDGLGFQLAPWRPGLEAHRGRAVSGVLEPGGMAWSLGRSRGWAL